MAYNWIKLQRKIITYVITWNVENVVLLHPHISGIFLGNVHLHGLIQFLKDSQFHAGYLHSILLICGGSLQTLYFSSAPIDKITNPHTLEIKYQAWNWLYFGNWNNPCKCIFPKKMPEMCGWISNISWYKVRDYFSLKLYSIVCRHAAGVLLSICRLEPGLSAVVITSRCAAGET